MLFSKKTYKIIDVTKGHKCVKCSHERKFNIVVERKWFVFIIIPLFPYKKRNLLVCSVCGAAYELKKPLKLIRKEKMKTDHKKLYDDIKMRFEKGEITRNEYIRMGNIIKYNMDDTF